jgi:6-pyruvoyltetrahydropterin/6-carboxytetrahydropterin synthase
MLKVCRIFRFQSAHRLPFHEGKCRYLHGHEWKLEVEVTGLPQTEGPEAGMIMDFKRLDHMVDALVIDKYDHRFLNDILENPTAEVMIYAIMVDLESSLESVGISLTRLRLWESENSYAEWTS